MKGYYLTFEYCNHDYNIGVRNKIEAQLKSFKNQGMILEFFSRENCKKCVELEKKAGAKLWRYSSYLFVAAEMFSLIKKNIKEKDIIYIRRSFCDYLFLRFLKKIKKYNPKIKIFIEIPTYPYDAEVSNGTIIQKISFIIDKTYRKKLDKYVDKIVTFSEDKEIFGIPCINISNGIDLGKVKMVNKEKKEEDNIVFTFVSTCCFWHGIDRFLNSLELYYKSGGKEKIIFNIVGEGPESQKLNEIVLGSDLLEKHVIFHGIKFGEELDELYNETDIAVGCLACHRKNIFKVQALKNREYCAKGLPMMFSEYDPELVEEKFVFKASADEHLIDIKEILKWYHNINMSPEEIREVSKKFTWDIQIKKILNCIQGE